MNRTIIERWRGVPGYESLYQVSDTGKVKSLEREVWNGKAHYIKKGRILKKSKTTTGYWKVELYKDGTRKSKKVHRLVAEAFIPPKEGDKNFVNHKDGNPLNNHFKNLEWCNQSENMRHAYDTGLIKSNLIKHESDIVNEYKNNKHANVKRLSRKYKCSESGIRNLLIKNNLEIKNISQAQDKYGIDRRKMVLLFKEGKSNKTIAEIFKTNSSLIGRYKYMHKKGELKI